MHYKKVQQFHSSATDGAAAIPTDIIYYLTWSLSAFTFLPDQCQDLVNKCINLVSNSHKSLILEPAIFEFSRHEKVMLMIPHLCLI